MFDKHYEEQTPYIQLDGVSVYANSMPLEVGYLNKKVRKLAKKHTSVTHYMNVIFEKKQTFENQLLWKLHEDVTEVVILEEKQLFVKGKPFWAYCVGIV